jgi:exopolysaccharide production protein ExoZ
MQQQVDREQNHRATKFESLQVGRGLAALMVVLYHTEGIFSLPKYWHGTSHFFHFGAAGVDFFFVLSGIVICHAHRKDIGNPAKFKDYCWKRLRRIYPIYWVVVFSTLPVYFLSSSLGSSLEKTPTTIAEALFLLPMVRVETIIPVAWTLCHEVMFYLVFSFLFWRRTAGAALMSIWMLASVWSLFHTPVNPVLASYISPLHLLFGLGLIVAMFVRRSSMPGPPLALIGLIGFSVLCYLEDTHRASISGLPIVFGLFAAMAAAGFMLYEKQSTLRIPPFLIFLGEASYSIYLVHYTTLSVSAKIVHRLWLLHPVPLWIPAGILLTVAVASGIALHLFVEKPLLERLPRAVVTTRAFRFSSAMPDIHRDKATSD